MVEEEKERGKRNKSERIQMFYDKVFEGAQQKKKRKVFEGYKQEEEMRTYFQIVIIAIISSTVKLCKCNEKRIKIQLNAHIVVQIAFHSIQLNRTQVDKLPVDTGSPKSISGQLACCMELDMPTIEEEPQYKVENHGP